MATADAKAKRREERVKLFASALSNVGVAVVVAGFIGPLVVGRFQALIAFAALGIGFCLHLVARGVLHYVASSPSAVAKPGEEAEV